MIALSIAFYILSFVLLVADFLFCFLFTRITKAIHKLLVQKIRRNLMCSLFATGGHDALDSDYA